MCGIAGIMNMQRCGSNIELMKELTKNMLNVIAHRGPDGEGQKVLDEGHVFLGHRRLAIIDLSNAASQPMQSLDGRYTITYNGEIYNYKELREELRKLGFSFFSSSDTEVVINAYAAWGEEALLKFNGIFAFSIWDDYRKELLIARDRYGAKPLYYAKIGNQFVFASEYKAIMLHPDFRKKVNLLAVKEYFTFQNLFTNQTFLQDIHILSAGCYMKIDCNMSKVPLPTQYWDFNFEEMSENISKEEYEEELNHLFLQAVKRQLVSDVALGSYLSGGIDSGFITAIASKYLPYLQTFTVGCDLHSASQMELSYDEREKAEFMSYKFKTEHYEMVLKSGDMERCMKDFVWHVEDPRIGQTYPNYYAAKLSSQFVKVVLAGTGGDEIFAGYPWRYYRAVNCRNFDEYAGQYYQFWQRILQHDEIKEVFSPVYGEIKEYSTLDVFKQVLHPQANKTITPEQNINNSLYLEAKTFLNGLLIVEDKISMAHGLETRVPFLDNDLVDFAMKLPVKLKLSNLNKMIEMNENIIGPKRSVYFQKSNDGKSILRNVMGRYIPHEITRDVKQGFSAPDASWFRGESIDYVKGIIDNSNSKIYDFMDKKAVQKSVARHFSGEENRRLLIWAYLNFENWLQLFA